MKYKAVVLGATGLVGQCLVQQLIADSACIEIRIIVRRKTHFSNIKVKECIIDFSLEENYIQNIKGDVLFSCLGTTRSQAKSIKNHYAVDYNYQLIASKVAYNNGIKKYVLVSSPWANIDSKNYYRKMKAELERDVLKIAFEKIAILKPNGLVGKREKVRFGEKYAIKIFLHLAKFVPFLKKHKPIEAKKVAQAMLKTYHKFATDTTRVVVLSRNELEEKLK